MKYSQKPLDRRSFAKKSTVFALGLGGLMSLPKNIISTSTSYQHDPFYIGPVEGFTPQIGTLVSILNYMSLVVSGVINDVSVEDLDHLLDKKANSIGALIMHTITIEKWCQIRTFGWKRSEILNRMDEFVDDLGDDARRYIKGYNSEFYQGELKKVRENTLKGLANRDDNWLMEIDEDHHWGTAVNNYCQWFHVIEHQAQHVGQIKFFKKRLTSVSNKR